MVVLAYQNCIRNLVIFAVVIEPPRCFKAKAMCGSSLLDAVDFTLKMLGSKI